MTITPIYSEVFNLINQIRGSTYNLNSEAIDEPLYSSYSQPMRLAQTDSLLVYRQINLSLKRIIFITKLQSILKHHETKTNNP